MIEINLLPEELKPRKAKTSMLQESPLARFTVPDIEPKLLFTWLLAAIVLIQAILFALQIFGKSQAARLNAGYAELVPRKIEADKIKGQLGHISRKGQAVERLLTRQVTWAEKLNALSDSMIPGIWLTSLSYDERISERQGVLSGTKASGLSVSKAAGRVPAEKYVAKFLIITGCVHGSAGDQTSSISKFIKNLKENPDFYRDFNSISVEDIKGEKFENQEIMTFRITCAFKE